MFKRVAQLFLAAVLTIPSAAGAVDIEVRPGTSPSLRDALVTARPGDRILMRAGLHVGCDWLEAHGTATQPIAILSADGPRTAVLQGCNGEVLRIGDASSYLVVDGLEIRNGGNNLIHIDGNSHHITLRNLYAHHAGPDGDVVKVNQASFITLENSELAFPGIRYIDSNPCQETFDFLDVDDAIIRDNYLHNGCGMLSVVKGASRRAVVERNIFDGSASRASDPVVGLGGATDLDLLNGDQFEAINLIFRNNVVFSGASGALGVYDVQGAYVAHNLFVNNSRVLVEFRAGEGPAARSEDIRFWNNVFVDTRGQMPPVFVRHSHAVNTLSARYNTYWNAGSPLPASPLLALTATAQPGIATTNPLVPAPGPWTTYAALVAGFRPPNASPLAGTSADASGSPFFVTTALGAIGGTLRLGRLDRGPYVLAGTVTPPCVPTTCVAQGKNCGSLPDGCGGTLACGTCTAPALCGGTGTANVCGTPPVTPTPDAGTPDVPTTTTPSGCSCVCTCR